MDADGTALPQPIAPFEVVLTVANMDQEGLRQAGEELYRQMQAGGVEVLFDDRAERPGVKFKDADLTGIPRRVTLGRKKFGQGLAEILDRSTGKTADVRIEEVVKALESQ
jgi:prolyl-tRNA synthetase